MVKYFPARVWLMDKPESLIYEKMSWFSYLKTKLLSKFKPEILLKNEDWLIFNRWSCSSLSPGKSKVDSR